MIKCLSRIPLVLLLINICPHVSLVAQPTIAFRAATFTGFVYIAAADANPIADAVVVVGNSERKWSERSNSDGRFKLKLAPGTYLLEIYKKDYIPICEEIAFVPGTNVSRRFPMASGEVTCSCTGIEPEGKIATTGYLPVDAMSLRLSPQSAPNIGVNGYAATDKVQRGHVVQVAVVMDIPHGYHVNSSRPLESFLKATQLKVEAPGGVRPGPVAYPRAVLRKFSFSNDKLSVYEGRVILRFSVTVPAGFKAGSLELKAKLNYQSCSDSLCFPPQSRDVRLQVPVVGATDSVKRINSEYFGRGR